MIQSSISLLNVSGAALCIAVVAGCASLALQWRARSRGLLLPPGPLGLPLLGNVFNFPTAFSWIKFQELSAEYGDVQYFRVLGQSIVVLNSATAISEYLDKNSANTSDRAQSFVLMVELTGNGHNLGFMRYGQRWRDHRRVLWQYFRGDAARAQQPTQRAVAHIFLEKLLTSPSKLEKHIRYAFAGSILHVTYGIDYTSDAGDKYSEAMSTAIVSATEGLVPGRFMVQYSNSSLLAQWREDNRKAIEMPYEYAQAEMHRQRSVQESMVGQHIAQLDRAGGISHDDEEVLKHARPLHSKLVNAPAGADTAIIMEIMRWYNVAPFGIPHGHVCTIHICSQPLEFRPERFIKDGEIDTTLVDPTVFIFGFGRRICPGRHFARSAIFITVASLLHGFDLSAPLDDRGEPIKIQPRFTDGLLSYPEDYRCTITPRSDSHAELIRANAAAARAALEAVENPTSRHAYSGERERAARGPSIAEWTEEWGVGSDRGRDQHAFVGFPIQ
ncbi:O-methylsterigmatocystin oxidoreductase [Epithele typhae]|uniref:O-methylsterigmatocystin oxidoreductase n=1 Tax=Epithele typhae TaxID=378194 RepID=UPI00200782B4|nr:O-methylsterigmatocystin oxidoreductase [Epithele typhae]KAH9929105.1 O-methylsterigmatocystin oxidoreductase [Epithele typhae]